MTETFKTTMEIQLIMVSLSIKNNQTIMETQTMLDSNLIRDFRRMVSSISKTENKMITGNQEAKTSSMAILNSSNSLTITLEIKMMLSTNNIQWEIPN